jgi:hypothetical protein
LVERGLLILKEKKIASLGQTIGLSFRLPNGLPSAWVFLSSFTRHVLFQSQFTQEPGKMLGLGVFWFIRLVMLEREFGPSLDDLAKA